MEGPVERLRPWKPRPSSCRRRSARAEGPPRDGPKWELRFLCERQMRHSATRPAKLPHRQGPGRPRRPEGVGSRSPGIRRTWRRDLTNPAPAIARTHHGRPGSTPRTCARPRQAHTSEVLPLPAPVTGVEAWPSAAPPHPTRALSRGQVSPCESELLVRPVPAPPPSSLFGLRARRPGT